MKNILIINAHQRYEGIAEGRFNQTLVDVAKGELESLGCHVQVTKVDAGYDIEKEQEKHLWADLIITQTPVYWFGTPWIHKKYIDEVFTAGLVEKTLSDSDGRTRNDPAKQYGSGGLMKDTKHMLSLTWNAPSSAFGDASQRMFEGKREEDVFVQVNCSYKFCGAETMAPFNCYDVWKNPQVDSDVKRYKEHLKLALNS